MIIVFKHLLLSGIFLLILLCPTITYAADPDDPITDLNCLSTILYEKPRPRILADPFLDMGITYKPEEITPAGTGATTTFEINTNSNKIDTRRTYTLEAWYCPYTRSSSGIGNIKVLATSVSSNQLIFQLPISVSSTGLAIKYPGLWNFVIYLDDSLANQIYSAQFLIGQPGGEYPIIAPTDGKTVVPLNLAGLPVKIKNMQSGVQYKFWWKECDGWSNSTRITAPSGTFFMPDVCSKYSVGGSHLLCMDISGDSNYKEKCRFSIQYNFSKNAISSSTTTRGGSANAAVGVKCFYDYNLGLAHITNMPGSSGKSKEGIASAVGCIPVSPYELIITVFLLGLGVGGGVAFLLMIMGAFEMIMSAGNPESLQSGQERFQSAVIGLLFVIFSILLVQIISSDILQIPGLTK